MLKKISDEEVWFKEWCKEALEIGLITKFTDEVIPMSLSDKVTIPGIVQLKTITKKVDKFLMHPHTYKPDFFVVLSWQIPELTLLDNSQNTYPVFIDIKGEFTGRKNSSNYTFPLNQKWVYDKYQIYVNKVIPTIFFKTTWCPQSIRNGKRGLPLKKWSTYPTKEEYLQCLK